MLIGDKYQVRTIPDNIVLEEKVKGDWVVLGYFSNLPNLLKHMVDHDITGMGFEDLRAVSNRQVELYLTIKCLDTSKVPLSK